MQCEQAPEGPEDDDGKEEGHAVQEAPDVAVHLSGLLVATYCGQLTGGPQSRATMAGVVRCADMAYPTRDTSPPPRELVKLFLPATLAAALRAEAARERRTVTAQLEMVLAERFDKERGNGEVTETSEGAED